MQKQYGAHFKDVLHPQEQEVHANVKISPKVQFFDFFFKVFVKIVEIWIKNTKERKYALNLLNIR